MGYLGRVSPGPADPQHQIKKTGNFEDHQNSTWCAGRARRACTLKPGAVNGTGNSLCPHTGHREQLGSPTFPRSPKNLHEPELAALSLASTSTERSSAREPRGARRKPGHFLNSRAAPSSVPPAGCWRKGPSDGLAAPRAGQLAGCCGTDRAAAAAGRLASQAGWLLGERASC